MNKFLFIAPVAIFISAGPSLAQSGSQLIANPVPTSVEHSGGCRKSSPAGQCCHAGSEPLHCH